MISSFILTVFASLCESSYFNVNYVIILLLQLIFWNAYT